MEDTHKIHQQSIAEDEIDLIALAKTVWNGRKMIIKIIIVFLIIGLFIAIFTLKQYSVTAVMVPQTSEGKGKLGGLSSLAAMAGFNLDMGAGSELNPVIYPQIVQSIPFKKALLQTKINLKGIDQPISLYDYYTKSEFQNFNLLSFIKEYTIGLPGTIKSAFQNNQDISVFSDSLNKIYSLSSDEYEIMEFISEIVYLNVNDRDGYLTLTAILPEAQATAQLGLNALELLQEFITKYKIEKAEAQLAFIQSRYDEKKKEFEQAQLNLANFRDQNKFVSTAIAQTEEERLQSEYQIAQSVYTELAKQLENAKIQVKEETPVLTVIEPITVPNKYFKPKRKLIVIIWAFLGIIVGIGWVFGKEFYSKLKIKWINHEN